MTEKTADKPMKAQRKKERKVERERVKAREQGHAARRGDKSSALEYLVFGSGAVVDANEQVGERMGQQSSGMRRLEAGLALRRYIAGARIGSLGSVNYETSSFGSSSNMPPSVHRLFCVEKLGAIRKIVGHDAYEMLDAVVDRDDFVWERVSPTTDDWTEPGDYFFAIAVGMQPKIDHAATPREATTPRQRVTASEMAVEADRLKRTQIALFALGEAHDRDAVPPLLKWVKHRRDVYILMETTTLEDEAGIVSDTGTPAQRSPEARQMWSMYRSANRRVDAIQRGKKDRIARASSRALERTYDGIRRALDAVAVAENLMLADDFRLRWGIPLEIPGEIWKSDIADRAADVAELINAGQRRR